MTKEEKNLVIKDISARLLYGIKINVIGDWFEIEREPYDIKLDINMKSSILNDFMNSKEMEIKPYLRPLSSITEDELEDFAVLEFKKDPVYKIKEIIKTGKGFINIRCSLRNNKNNEWACTF